jgi:hypothetical protein
MAQVFICHSEEDQSIADAVYNELKKRGIKCWIDCRNISPGRKWAEEILKALKESTHLLLILSKYSNKSPFVLREVEYAFSKEKIIITLIVDDVIPSEDLEFFTGSRHYLRAVTPPRENHIQYLAEQVDLLQRDAKPERC